MQINVAVAVETPYGGIKDCRQVDIQIETDKFGHPFFNVAGTNGLERFVILNTQDGAKAVKKFWTIKKKLLEEQQAEARRRQDDF